MRGIQYIPPDTKIPFMKFRFMFLVISTVLILGSVFLFAIRGLNLGIDFSGGILVEIRTDGPADLAKLRATLNSLDLGEVGLQEFGEPDDVLIRFERQEGDEKAQQVAVERIKQALGPGIEFRRVEVVGPQVSSELFTNGLLALFAAIGGIVIYIWFRFEWQFAVGGVIAELHDIICTIGLFALTGMEFNLTSVAALLTIAGYSINDTVVIYDRVRENLRKYKTMPLAELFDLSLNQTLSRTFNTGITTLLALTALYIFGGEVISGFALAMIFGVLIGTYSSIGAAVPLLLAFKFRRPGTPADDAVTSPR